MTLNLKYAVGTMHVMAICCTAFFGHAQTLQPEQTHLNQISDKQNSLHLVRVDRARSYAVEHNVPMHFNDGHGNTVYLIGVDDFGLPIYRTTLNAGAAITTGVAQLRTGGSVGLNLNGRGMVVGVWDEAKVKDHVEFGDRIISRQGTEFSGHATHVTGTILAAGIDAKARGMASMATAMTWDFNNDEAEMAALAKPDQSTLLLSNHSYGILMGFYYKGDKWFWAGNTAISTKEDYRFGFYDESSKTFDQIAFNAPYYTMVWACGNDRGQNGDDTHPPDGNEGTGYDCLGPDGVSKNIITVGAVNKVLNYTGPASVVMSNFSSWGPTDDGRIKPDLAAAGVGMYSTFVNGEADAYSVQQGTSMAAPNVTGSLTLVQALYRDLHAGKFMRAATLKGLAIHSAKEAGLSPGPDYSYGWGLLDVEAAAEILLAEDNSHVIVQEKTLVNNQVYSYAFDPLANTKVTATIVWTDPAGNPVAPALDPTTRMLVNDLDIRLIDETNKTQFPWILDPANPSVAAARGDNTRDNVEKIEYTPNAAHTYRLVVSHKGTLVNAKQDFSVVLTFTPKVSASTTYYWIGNSGDWNDGTKWSLTSGGVASNKVPSADSRIIIDNNSFKIKNSAITLTADATCSDILWLASQKATLTLNDRTLIVNGSVTIASDSLTATKGVVEIGGSSTLANQLNFKGNDFSQVDLVINTPEQVIYTLNGQAGFYSLIMRQGTLVAKNSSLTLNSLEAQTLAFKSLDLSDAILDGVTQSSLSSATLSLFTNENTLIKMGSTASTLTWSGIYYRGTLQSSPALLTLAGGITINKVMANGPVTILDNNTFNEFATTNGSVLKLQSGSIQTFSNPIVSVTDATHRLAINTTSIAKAKFKFTRHAKGCFDFIDVNGVDVEGDVVMSAGLNSTLTNSINWTSGACTDALFPDFSIGYNCKGALAEFTDRSEGNATTWSWAFGDTKSTDNTSTLQNPTHIFNNAGSYQVTLTLTNALATKTFSKAISIMPNSLPANYVILSSNKLFSEQTAAHYQWYKDGEKITSETNRSYDYKETLGNYVVVIANETCNLPSTPSIITGLAEFAEDRISVSPNPTSNTFVITLPTQWLPSKVVVRNSIGIEVLSTEVRDAASSINVSGLESGLYIVAIKHGTNVIYKRLIIQR